LSVGREVIQQLAIQPTEEDEHGYALIDAIREGIGSCKKNEKREDYEEEAASFVHGVSVLRGGLV
jgi:hypothetical protein